MHFSDSDKSNSKIEIEIKIGLQNNLTKEMGSIASGDRHIVETRNCKG